MARADDRSSRGRHDRTALDLRFGHDETAAAMWHDNAWRTADRRLIEPPATAAIGLWHPLNAAPPLVSAWRDYLEAEQITQPFKQAHREIYLLTDAERTTATYSNRFAGHIIRQASFACSRRLAAGKPILSVRGVKRVRVPCASCRAGTCGRSSGSMAPAINSRQGIPTCPRIRFAFIGSAQPNHYPSSRFHLSCFRRSCAMSISSSASRRSATIPHGRTVAPRDAIATTGKAMRSASCPAPPQPASRS